MPEKLRILICGGGNGAHTLAALVTSCNTVEVNILTLFADEAERWVNILGHNNLVAYVSYNNGSKGEVSGKPRLITNDPKAAMDGVDAVFFVVPAFAHQQYFDAIHSYLQPNTIIVGMPGQSGFEFQAMHVLKECAAQCAIISLESLPWACRILEFGKKVQILGFKEVLGASVIPGKGSYKMEPLALAQSVLGKLPKLVKTNNYLAVNLMAKSFVHPPILYSKWRNWDGNPSKSPPLFYQGVDDEQESVLAKVSDEVVAIAKAVQQKVPELNMTEVIHIFDWYKGYYADQISDFSSLKSCMCTNRAYDGLTHPMKKVDGGYVPDFSNRYLSEDIPYGLVVMKGIAECVGVKTPMIDEVTTWAQVKLGKEYLVNNELKGKDVSQTRAPQAYGFTKLEQLINVL